MKKKCSLKSISLVSGLRISLCLCCVCNRVKDCCSRWFIRPPAVFCFRERSVFSSEVWTQQKRRSDWCSWWMWLIAAQADFWEFVSDDHLVAITQQKDSSAQNNWERERELYYYRILKPDLNTLIKNKTQLEFSVISLLDEIFYAVILLFTLRLNEWGWLVACDYDFVNVLAKVERLNKPAAEKNYFLS